MSSILNQNLAKHIDPNIYRVLIDLENLQNSVTVYEKLLYLNGVLTKLANTENKYSFDFLADIFEELTLIYRELHQQKVEAFAVFENQEFVTK